MGFTDFNDNILADYRHSIIMDRSSGIFCDLIGIFFVPFYFTLFTGWDGRTLGKWLFGLRVIRVTGEQVGYGRAFVRYLGYIVSLLFFGLGFIMIAVDRNKRGVHDLIAGTCVIKVRD